MPAVNSNVVIIEHDLLLQDAAGNELARLDHDGILRIRREVGGSLVEVLRFDAATNELTIGAAGVPSNEGDVIVRDGAGRDAIHLNGGNAGVYVGNTGQGGDVFVQDGGGRSVIHLDGGTAWLRVGVDGNEGDLEVQDGSGRQVLHFNGGTAWLRLGAEGNEGDLEVVDGSGRQVFHLDGENAWLQVGAQGNDGDIEVIDDGGRSVFHVDGGSAWVRIGGSGNEGDLEIQDGAGRQVFHFNSEIAWLALGAEGNEGDLVVRDSAGADRIHLDGGAGDIKLMGADLAEDFSTRTPVPAGTVVAAVGMDEVEPTATAMDRRVVGVASGAGELRPALRLGRKPGANRVPVALTGRVFCKADAGYGAIAIGDLLTSSPTEGHAMKVSDHQAAAGAVLGKALGTLGYGTGLIPVLVTLQ